MSEPEQSAGTNPQFARERLVIGILCALAAIRVLTLCAAFPLFNNVDEYFHYDYVWKCAHGEIPRPLQKISPEVGTVILMYSWLAYYQETEDVIQKKHLLPPVWMLPKYLQKVALANWRSVFTERENHESVQPPLYYIATGLWYRLGALMGMPERILPFWVRFFNVPMVVLLVWMSYCLTRLLFPQSLFLRLGVPMFVASLPQDVFYSISNSALGPVMYTVALYALALVYLREEAGYRAYAAAGLAVGATLVTSYTTVPILLVVAAVGVACVMRARKAGQPGAVWPKLLVLCAALALLPAIWVMRNYAVFGESTATPLFVRNAGWTPKPFAQMLHHPIFTWNGATYFWGDMMGNYFRGEFVWHGKRMSYPWLDWFYAWSALLFLLVAFASFLPRRSPSKFIGLMSAGLFAASACMLVLVSIRFDFGKWFMPSRTCPYYTGGRLILGTIAPFAFLYLTGLDILLRRLRLGRVKFVVLAAMCGLMVGADVVMSLPAFATKCNFFHLLTLRP